MNGRSLFPPFGGKHPPRLFWFAFAKTGIFGGIYERALTYWCNCAKRWRTVFLAALREILDFRANLLSSLTYWCNCTKRWCTVFLAALREILDFRANLLTSRSFFVPFGTFCVPRPFWKVFAKSRIFGTIRERNVT